MTSYDAITALIDPITESDDSLTDDEILHRLLRFMLGPNVHETRIATLKDYLSTRKSIRDNATLIGLLSLITTMPEYQLC